MLLAIIGTDGYRHDGNCLSESGNLIRSSFRLFERFHGFFVLSTLFQV